MGRKSEKEMFEWMRRYEEGKTPRKEIFKATGIKAGSFQYWWKRYRDKKEVNSSKRGFVPLKLTQESAELGNTSARMEVILRNGIVVRFEELIPVKYLSELMRLV